MRSTSSRSFAARATLLALASSAGLFAPTLSPLAAHAETAAFAYPLYAQGQKADSAPPAAESSAVSASRASEGTTAPEATDSAGEIGAAASLPCEPGTAEPLHAIVGRLDERRSYARLWWMGFTGFYGLGTLVTAYQAAEEDDAGKRAVDIVSSVKAAFGTTRLLFDRPAALYGGVPVRKELPDCNAALAKGEELMRRAAKETRSRASWKRHLSIVGINALGAVVAGEGWGERGKAWTSAGIGVVVGEIMAWSHPWHGVDDLDEYEARFPDRRVQSTPKLRWALLPSTSGVVLRAEF